VIFAALGLSVEWIYAALVGDYALKGWMLTRRFRSGRWRNLQLANTPAAQGF
jgi:Na+-driven multidrug efflux pump